MEGGRESSKSGGGQAEASVKGQVDHDRSL